MIEDQVKYSLDYCPVIELIGVKDRFVDSFTSFPSNCFKIIDPKDLNVNLFAILPF